MIWKSMVLMTIFDVAIISVAIASLTILFLHRNRLGRSGALMGSSIVVLGLVGIGLFYLVDLFTMFVLPLLTTRQSAMTAMENLHLDYSWIVILLGILSVFAGLAIVNRKLVMLIDSLERTEIHLNRELTARREAERALRLKAAELEQLNRGLQEANRAKSDFTAAMSHELRTPLHVIIGYTDLLAEGMMGELNNEQKESLETIRRHSHILVKLVRDVLTLARIGAKKMTLNITTARLDEAVEHLRPFVEQLNRDRRLEVLWEVQRDLPPLATDHMKLEEILQNLIANAYRFTPDGRIEIRVQARDTDRIEFAVADTGMGIEESELGRIFEEFHQSRDSHTGTQGGVGLGLSIVKKYLDLLQGEIRVESQLGAGTTFIFTLPYSIDLEPDQASEVV
jgi:signal transduction histidine kinase